MFKSARDLIQRASVGNRVLLLLRISFLITCVLWFWGFYALTDSFGDIIVNAVVSVVLAIFTFEWVAVGISVLLIPVVILGRMIADAFRNSDG